MNNYLKTLLITVLAITSLSACFDDDKETDIPLTEVPTNIVNIVQNTLPGISITEAEKEIKGDVTIYELEGKMINGNEYEIKIISRAGTMMTVVAWLIFLVILFGIFDYSTSQRNNPNQNIVTAVNGYKKEVTLLRNAYGHYVTNGTTNNIWLIRSA